MTTKTLKKIANLSKSTKQTRELAKQAGELRMQLLKKVDSLASPEIRTMLKVAAHLDTLYSMAFPTESYNFGINAFNGAIETAKALLAELSDESSRPDRQTTEAAEYAGKLSALCLKKAMSLSGLEVVALLKAHLTMIVLHNAIITPEQHPYDLDMIQQRIDQAEKVLIDFNPKDKSQ